MSEDEIIQLLIREAQQVFVFRFTDGREVELTDCWVREDERGRRECLATVVRPGDMDAAPGEGLCFDVRDVTDVRISKRGFDYFR